MTGSKEQSTSHTDDGSDELDSLVVPGNAPAAHADDDVIDLGALTKLSASARPSAAEPEAPSPSFAVPAPRLLDQAPVLVPAPKHGSTAWLLPLVIGFLAGMPAGALLLGGRSAAPPAAAAAPASPTSPVPPTAATAGPTVVDTVPAQASETAQAPGAPAREPDDKHATHTASTERSAPPASAAARADAPVPEAHRGAWATDVGAEADPVHPQAIVPAPDMGAAPQQPVLSLTKLEPADPVEAAFPEVKSGAAPNGAPKSMNDLLDDAIAGAPRPTAAPETQAFAAAEAPLSPSRQDVSDSMAVLVPAIRGCAMGQAGLATAAIVVQNDGKVASVKVTGSPFEGAASGRCMEGVVRRARFPRFRQPVFRVQFPFAIE